jgi:signal transduction histidine kinase/CheY-like chemotaxis protein
MILEALIKVSTFDKVYPTMGDDTSYNQMEKLKFEYRFIAGYLVIGCLWILFSDKLLIYFVRDPDLLTMLQTFKGWFYVIITAIIFYLLLKSHLVKIRLAEQKAIDSDKLKTAFLQNISHEIRTPMNSIVGFSELLKSNKISEKEQSEYLDMIAKGSDQLLNIVNEVLDISLIETGNITIHKQKFRLNTLLDEIYLSFKPSVQAGISLNLSKGLPDKLSLILTDAIKLKQIINNLLNNAIKFTDKGHIDFGYSLKEGELEFYIEDTGIGIDADFHNKVFDRFRKLGNGEGRLYEGVGLGLAISKGNVDLLQGRIWVESTPNEGSKFYFTLPYEPAMEEEITEAEAVRHELEGKLNVTILVAEDDDINFIYIKEIFRGTGAVILHALNGKEAVEFVQDNDKISLVLIDIKMPIMNGYEAIKKIRELRPSLPIIAQTAFALSNEMLKAFNAGSNDYISKPFRKEQLLTLVEKYIPVREQ